MTDQELEQLMQRVLLDALKQDWPENSTPTNEFSPSKRYLKQLRVMLANPLGWAKKRARPVWKAALHRVAVIFLVFTLSLGSLMAISPTVRATVIRWVTEWYETHIVYRYSGSELSDTIPQFEITNLPDGYSESKEDRIEDLSYVRMVYQNNSDESAEPIYFRYIHMQQGSALSVFTEDSEIYPITVAGMNGELLISKDLENTHNTLTWINDNYNLQFIIDARLNEHELLRIAESISLVPSKE